MFVRVKSTPNSPKRSVQLVKSVRKGKKVSQKIVRHVGTALTEKELKALKDLAEMIKAEMEQEVQPGILSPEDVARQVIESRDAADKEKPLPVDLTKLREEKRITLGVHEVYGKLYKELGFGDILGRSKQKETARNHLEHLVLARIAAPKSKRATVRELSDHFGVDMSLSAAYRTMDHLDDRAIEQIQDTAKEQAQTLFGTDLSVLFYDCTTLYFESFTEDDLKQNGYSKDKKFNQPQVLLALLVTQAGIPVGYEVFPGSTFEGHTLQEAVTQVERKYTVKDLVFVADSAMLGKANLRWLESHGKRYIVGARLKNMSRAKQKHLLDTSLYRDYDGDLYNQIVDIPHGEDRRLIVTYNEKRAKKDRKDRGKALRKLLKKLKKSSDPLSFVSSYGYKRFLKSSADTTVEIDKERVKKAEQWDGLHGVVTNIPDMTAEQVREHYHGLWQVEESFRISKHDLKVRPIYHWTPRRVRAHIALCFMALTLIRHCMYRTKLQYKPLSAEEIRRHLSSVQVSLLNDTGTKKQYAMPSAITPEAAKLYNIMGLHASATPFEITT